MIQPIKAIAIFTICMLGTNGLIFAQDEQTLVWINSLGGKAWDRNGGIVCNSENNAIVAGTFLYTLYCDTMSVESAGADDIYIAFFEEYGSIKNILDAGGKGKDIANCMTILENNDVIIGGSITDTAYFGDLFSPGTVKRLFIASIKNDTSFSWISTLVPNSTANLSLVGADGENNIYVAGIFSGSLSAGDKTIYSEGGFDIFLARISSAGMVEKLQAFGGNYDDDITDLYISASGNILIAGSAGNDFYVKSFLITADHDSDPDINSHPFILSLNSDFEPIWKTQIYGDEYCVINSLEKDPAGNLYATGSFNMSAVIEDSLFASQGYSDGFLMKYGSDNEFTWARSFGSWYYDYSSDLIFNSDGKTLVIGTMGDSILIDNLKIVPDEESISSAFVIQFSEQGEAMWVDCITGSGRIEGAGLCLDQEGSPYITGNFNYGSIKTKEDTIISNGDQDVFIAKYYNCIDVKDEISGIELICPGETTELIIDPSYHNIIWNDVTHNVNTIIVEQPGLYWVNMLDDHGCPQTDTFMVDIIEVTGFSLGDDLSVPVDSSILLQGPEDFTDYHWQDGSDNETYLATAENEEPGTYMYWLTAIDAMGCTSSDTILIEFYFTTGLYDYTHDQITVYPNPAQDWLNLIYSKDQPGTFVVEFYNLKGQLVCHEIVEHYIPGSVLRINLNNLNKEIYYLILINSSGEHSTGSYVIIK